MDKKNPEKKSGKNLFKKKFFLFNSGNYQAWIYWWKDYSIHYHPKKVKYLGCSTSQSTQWPSQSSCHQTSSWVSPVWPTWSSLTEALVEWWRILLTQSIVISSIPTNKNTLGMSNRTIFIISFFVKYMKSWGGGH